ncbi:MAG: S4 domain-containing protein, partial [Oscillospiraceae bacterium]
PTSEVGAEAFKDGAVNVLDLLMSIALIPSKGEGRRLIQQGGVAIDDVKITDIATVIKHSDFEKGFITVKKGKKIFHKVILK